MDKVGAFICTGCEIGEAIDVDELEEGAEEAGASTFMTHPCLCAPEGVAEIKKAIEEEGIDGIVIGACSHREKKDVFAFDPKKVVVERASLREQCAWSHEPKHEDTQMIADDLIRMFVSKASRMKVDVPFEEEIDDTVLIVGGGMAGLTAAQAASAMGKPVVIVEKEDALGGYLVNVKDLVPEHPPYDKPVANNISDLIAAVEADSNIKICTGTATKAIDGQPGQFKVELANGDTFTAGAIVQATGATPYDASKLTHLGYGQSKDVITSKDLEDMIFSGNLACPSTGKPPKRIVFIQCAGSRDENHLKHCSSECCATSMKQVAAIGRDFPEVECAVVYRDMRMPGQLEHFYVGVQESSNCMLTRGDVQKVEAGGNGAVVQVTNSLIGEDISLEADLVVLAVGMVPNSADSESIRELKDAYGRIEKNESKTQVEEAQKLVDKLKHVEGTEILNLNYRQGPDLPLLRDGYPDSHYICFPYETRRTGIYAAGAVHAPMDVAQAIEDGYGSAIKAVQNIESNKRGDAVHPRAGDASFADFFMQRCTQCKRCTEECPFGALNEDEKGTPEYNVARCRRCGICFGACPERIISFPGYSIDAVSSMIKAFEMPEEEDEKPRILAFMCENDALPALDEAAKQGIKWNPWVRIIPVRCLGAINQVWIADSLSNGWDGIMLIGCQRGDDYQCHYMQGSELAHTRMENMQETLDRLALEGERVEVHELARDEFKRIPEILDAFVEVIDEVGPNPMKGF